MIRKTITTIKNAPIAKITIAAIGIKTSDLISDDGGSDEEGDSLSNTC